MDSLPTTPPSPTNQEESNSITFIEPDVKRSKSEIVSTSTLHEKSDIMILLENLGISYHAQRKKLLYLLLAENPPKYIKTSVRFRSDSISIHNVLGVFLLLELTPELLINPEEARLTQSVSYNPTSIKFLVWIPYESLMVINERYVVHMKSNGELVSQVKVRYEKQDDSYISAKLKEPLDGGLDDSPIDKIPKFNLAILIPLKELFSLELQPKSHGFTTIQLVKEENLNPMESSRMGKRKTYGPFSFQDGGSQNFLDELENYMQFYKFPDKPTIYLQEKNDALDRSFKRMDFDDFYTDILREEGAGRGPTRGFLEWGAKLSKEVNNLQVGFRKLIGGKKQDFDTKEALKRLQEERKNRNLQVEQIVPDESENAPEEEDFEVIGVEQVFDQPKWSFDENTAISMDEWNSVWMQDGAITDSAKLRTEICYRGIQDEARAEIWPFLLGFYPWDSTQSEREKLLQTAKKEYQIYLYQWSSITERQREKHSTFKERLHRIEKDVVRTDRSHPMFKDENSEYLKILHRILMSYAFYNFDLGYCQGMGDILSPILSVMKDEALTFWCYTTLMDNRVHKNFHLDSIGMANQFKTLLNIIQTLDFELYTYLESRDAINLFFCFRWILILFKREFEFEEVKRIWECLFTNEHGENMHLFMCYAILQLHRDNIMQGNLGFDDILQYFVDLSQKVDIHQVMAKTFLCIQEYQDVYKNQKRMETLLTSGGVNNGSKKS